MPDFAILSSNIQVAARGAFDHAEIRIGRRRYDAGMVVSIVVNPTPQTSTIGRRLRGAGVGAAGGGLFGGVIGAAIGATLGANFGGAGATPPRTQAAMVFSDGLVLVAELAESDAGALRLIAQSLADSRRSPPSIAAPPPDTGETAHVTVADILAALPGSRAFAGTAQMAIAAIGKIPIPSVKPTMRKK